MRLVSLKPIFIGGYQGWGPGFSKKKKAKKKIAAKKTGKKKTGCRADDSIPLEEGSPHSEIVPTKKGRKKKQLKKEDLENLSEGQLAKIGKPTHSLAAESAISTNTEAIISLLNTRGTADSELQVVNILCEN